MPTDFDGIERGPVLQWPAVAPHVHHGMLKMAVGLVVLWRGTSVHSSRQAWEIGLAVGPQAAGVPAPEPADRGSTIAGVVERCASIVPLRSRCVRWTIGAPPLRRRAADRQRQAPCASALRGGVNARTAR